MIPMWQMMVGVCVGLVAFLIMRPTPIGYSEECGGGRRRNRDGTASGGADAGGTRYNSKPEDPCVICLAEMRNDNMTYLRCGHALHDDCYKDLRRHSKECPICRQRL